MGAFRLRRLLHSVTAFPTLQTLTFTPASAASGTAWSATISVTTTLSTLTATSSDGTTLTVTGSGTSRTISGTFSVNGTPTITMVETLAGAIGSPKTSTQGITVASNPTLGALSFSPTTAVATSAWSATVVGATTGSTITGTASDGTTITVTGTGTTRTVSGTFAASGTPTVTLTETLAGATNTPHTNSPTSVTVSSAATVPYVTPGSVVSSGTHLSSSWAATSTPAAQGTALQEGYAYPPAGVNWASDRFQESVTSGGVANDVYIGVVCAGTPDLTSYAAGDVSCNMLKVELAIGGGTYVANTAMSAHPVTGKVAFWFRVKATDLGSNSSGLYEVRAICTPKIGQCKVLQGPDPTSLAILAYQDVFSHYVVLDKGDLARQVIYKAPNDGTTEAADTHAGTSGDPCLTWKRARALHKAHASYPAVLTTYALTASQNHEWGLTSAGDTPVESTIGWTRVQPAPGLTSADVAIVRPATGDETTTGYIPFRKFFLNNVNIGSVPLYNLYGGLGGHYGPGSGYPQGQGYYNNTTLGIDTGFHNHLENIITTARPTTLVASSADINYNQPTALDYFEHGNQCLTVEFVNCQIQYTANSAFYQATYVRDCTLNHINNENDIADNMRYAAGLRFYNTQAWNQVNHLDALQPTLTAPNKGCWLEDCVVSYLDGNTQNGYGGFQGTMDGILCDDGHNYHNSVFLRLLLHTGTGHDISMGSVPQNNRFINCDTAGQGIIPGWQFNLTAALSAPANNVWFLHSPSNGTGVANFEMVFRKGIKHVYPFSARLPNPGTAIPTSTLKAAIGTTSPIYGIWDFDVDEYAMRVHHDNTWPSTNYYTGGVTKIRGVIDANWPEVATRLNTGSTATPSDYIIGAQANQFQQPTDTKWPQTVEGTHRRASFVKANSQSLKGNIPTGATFVGSVNSSGVLTVTEIGSLSVPLAAGATFDYAGTLAAGCKITSQLSGTTGGLGTYQLNVTGGDGLAYVMWTGIQRTDTLTLFGCKDIKADTDTSASYFFHAGGGTTGKSYIGRQYIAGKQRIIFEAGQSQAAGANATYTYGDSGTGSLGTSFPAIEGPTVIALEVKSDRLRMTYWNANTVAVSNTGDGTGGYFVDAPYVNGTYGPYHLFINSYPAAIGSISGGEFGFSSFDANSFTLTGLLGSTDKANVLAEMKTRMGL